MQSANLLKHISVLKSQTCLSKLSLPLDNLITDLSTENEETLFPSNNHLELIELVKILCEIGQVREFSLDIDREFEEKDFRGVATVAFKCLKSLNIILKRTSSCEENYFSPVTVCILQLCGTHSQECLWSNSNCVEQQTSLLNQLCDYHQCKSLPDFISSIDSDKNDLAKRVLDQLKPRLSTERWKRNPGTCQIFCWILLSIPAEIVPEILQTVFPPILLFLDDFRLENQLMGVECCHYLICNTTTTSLIFNGFGEVLYAALFHLTHSKEVRMIEALYPCLLSLISNLEKDSNRVDRIKKPGKLDAVYIQLMRGLELESKSDIIDCLTKLLPLYIDKLGITILRHLPRTLEILFAQLSTTMKPDEVSRIWALRSLRKLIIVAWPRVPSHMESIMKALSRVLYDIKLKSQFPKRSREVEKVLNEEVRDCLSFLKKCNPEMFNDLIILLEGLESDIPIVKDLEIN